MNSLIALFAKSGSAAILKNLASFKNESPSTKVGVQDCQSAVSESSDDAMFLHFFLVRSSWERSGSVVECLNRDYGPPRVRTSPASLCYAIEQEH